MKKIAFICAIAFTMGQFACTRTFGTGAFLGSRAFHDYTVLSNQRVQGKGCKYSLLMMIPLGEMSINAAFKDAMENSPPGTDGLANVAISINEPAPFISWAFLFPFLVYRTCFVLEGEPVRTNPEVLSQLR